MRVLIFISFLFISITSFAQLKEAYFQYNIELEAVDSSVQAKQTVAMLRNSKMELYFAPNKTRMDFKMGGISMTSVIMDRDKDVVLSLNESFAGKKAMLGKPNDPSEVKNSNAKTTTFTDQKTILGYKCTKFVVEENGVTTVYWITKDIQIDSKDQAILNTNLPGFPVAFSKVEDGVKMSFQLTNIKEKLDNPIESIFFTDVPAGFTLIKGN
jgi:type II secretory pathway component PulC